MRVPETIFQKLQQEIVLLQGYNPQDEKRIDGLLPASITRNFFGNVFPLNGVHEFFSESDEDDAATTGFVSGILATVLQNSGIVIWVSRSCSVFPPALAFFGIAPHRVVFLRLKKENELCAGIEESLKCSGLAAVVGELGEIDLTGSRRLQLAVEQSGVTCFLIRRNPKNITTAAIARWKISSIPASNASGLPGIGFPCWKTELLKARNGKPGAWELEWHKGKFRTRLMPAKYIPHRQSKTA